MSAIPKTAPSAQVYAASGGGRSETFSSEVPLAEKVNKHRLKITTETLCRSKLTTGNNGQLCFESQGKVERFVDERRLDDFLEKNIKATIWKITDCRGETTKKVYKYKDLLGVFTTSSKTDLYSEIYSGSQTNVFAIRETNKKKIQYFSVEGGWYKRVFKKVSREDAKRITQTRGAQKVSHIRGPSKTLSLISVVAQLILQTISVEAVPPLCLQITQSIGTPGETQSVGTSGNLVVVGVQRNFQIFQDNGTALNHLYTSSIGGYNIDGFAFANNGTRMYVAQKSGSLMGYNITDPSNPGFIAADWLSSMDGVPDVYGDFVLAANGNQLRSYFRGNITVADALTINPPGNTHGVAHIGKKGFVLANNAIAEINLQDPMNMIQTTFYSTAYEATRIASVPKDNLLLVLVPTNIPASGVHIFNATNMAEIGFFPRPASSDFTLFDEYGCVTLPWGAVDCFSRVDPTNPVSVDYLETPGNARGIGNSGGKLFVADGSTSKFLAVEKFCTSSTSTTSSQTSSSSTSSTSTSSSSTSSTSISSSKTTSSKDSSSTSSRTVKVLSSGLSAEENQSNLARLLGVVLGPLALLGFCSFYLYSKVFRKRNIQTIEELDTCVPSGFSQGGAANGPVSQYGMLEGVVNTGEQYGNSGGVTKAGEQYGNFEGVRNEERHEHGYVNMSEWPQDNT